MLKLSKSTKQTNVDLTVKEYDFNLNFKSGEPIQYFQVSEHFLANNPLERIY